MAGRAFQARDCGTTSGPRTTGAQRTTPVGPAPHPPRYRAHSPTRRRSPQRSEVSDQKRPHGQGSVRGRGPLPSCQTVARPFEVNDRRQTTANAENLNLQVNGGLAGCRPSSRSATITSTTSRGAARSRRRASRRQPRPSVGATPPVSSVEAGATPPIAPAAPSRCSCPRSRRPEGRCCAGTP
jgi:hypothetical protein